MNKQIKHTFWTTSSLPSREPPSNCARPDDFELEMFWLQPGHGAPEPTGKTWHDLADLSMSFHAKGTYISIYIYIIYIIYIYLIIYPSILHNLWLYNLQLLINVDYKWL